jgi:hypothetical protein
VEAVEEGGADKVGDVIQHGTSTKGRVFAPQPSSEARIAQIIKLSNPFTPEKLEFVQGEWIFLRIHMFPTRTPSCDRSRVAPCLRRRGGAR